MSFWNSKFNSKFFKFTPLGAYMNLMQNIFKEGGVADNLKKKLTGEGMTSADKEAAALSLENQQILNQEEYDRKIDFYERYESPEARVRQYKEAGLNPMLLAGGGAGVSASGGVGSAGSAPADNTSGGADLLSALTGLIGLTQKAQQLKLDRMDAETRRYDAETRRTQSIEYMDYLRSLTENKDEETLQMREMFPLKKENLEKQTTYYSELARSEEGRRRLMESGVELNDAEKAIKLREEAILAAQEKYADQYYSAVQALTYYQSRIAYTQSEFERRTLEKRIEGLNYQVSDMLFEAALKSKAFTNFGPMQVREWINTGARVITSLGGVALGVSGLSSGAAAINQATSAAFARSISPGQAVMSGGLLYPNMFSVQ